jgi:ligand-binding sensor protein
MTNTRKTLNMDTVYSYADSYETATGIRCAVIDSKGRELHRGKICCELCDKLRESPEFNEKCIRNHLYGAYQAERFGGKYVFFCHMGLAHFISPVTEDGLVKGALLGGPIILSNDEELQPEDIIGNQPFAKELLKYKDYFNHIPMVSTLRTEALSDILYSVAIFVSYGTQGPYLMSECQSLLRYRCWNLRAATPVDVYIFICLALYPRFANCSCSVLRFIRPGSTIPSHSRMFINCDTLRLGTCLRRRIACSNTWDGMASSVFLWLFPLGFKPSNPASRYCATYLRRVRSDIPVCSHIRALISFAFAGSRPSASSGDISSIRCCAIVSAFL